MPAARAPPPLVGRPAPAATRRRADAGQRERAPAGCAPGPFPAAGAAQGRDVAAARHLHQHRPAGQPVTRGAQDQAGQPRGLGCLIPGEFAVAARGPDRGGVVAEHGPARDDRPRPAAGHEAGGLGRPGEPADQDGGAGAVRAQREHLAGVRVGGARLGVQVIAVIPEHHESEVTHRREHRRTSPRHHPLRAAPDGQPASVPFGGSEVRGQRDMPAGTELRGERLVQQGEVARIGNHGQGAPPGRRRRGHRPGDFLRPLRAGQGRPHGARPPPAGQGVEEPWAVRVPGPRARSRPYGGGPVTPGMAPPGGRSPGVTPPGVGRGRGFGAGVPGRDGQPEHVGQGARPAVSDLAGQGHDLRAEHRLG